jgi:cytochrome c oxidase subunit II
VLILVIIAIPSFRLLYAQYDMPKADVTLKITGVQWFWKVEYQTAQAPAGAPAAAAPADAAAPVAPAEQAPNPNQAPANAASPAPTAPAAGAPAPEASAPPAAAPPAAAEAAATPPVPGTPIAEGDAPLTADFEMEVRLKPKDQVGEEPWLLAVDNQIVVPVGKVVRVQVTAADVLHAFAVPSFGVKVDAVPGRLNETWFRADREGVYYGQCSELCGREHAYMPLAFRVVSEADYQTWLTQARAQYAEIEIPNAVADASATNR